MEDGRRLQLRDSYLEHILIYLRSRNRDSSFFGTLVDSWYAYHRGGIFIKSTGTPRTLTNPNKGLERKAMAQLPYISIGAGKILFEGAPGRLVREHCIPKAYLEKMITGDHSLSWEKDAVQRYLERFYQVAALTTDEHNSIKHLSESMPFEWDRTDCYARYATIPRYEPNAD